MVQNGGSSINKKNINSTLTKIHNDFLRSIKDEKVKELVKQNTIITGGAIANMLLKEEVNDYDMYFKNYETCLAVTKYYVTEFNKFHDVKASITDEEGRIKIFISSDGVAGDDPTEPDITSYEDANEEVHETQKYDPVYLTSNAITLKGKIQLIIRFYGSPEEIHQNYDFAHCTNYWESSTKKTVFREKALECLLNKELVYIGSKYPLCSIIRTRKFLNRGFIINAGQYLKMCMQISELNLADINTLEDQLVGVDTAYFAMLIDALKTNKEANPDLDINAYYVSEIVDRIF